MNNDYVYFTDDRNKYNGDVLIVEKKLFENNNFILFECKWFCKETYKLNDEIEVILFDKINDDVLNGNLFSFRGVKNNDIEDYLLGFFHKYNLIKDKENNVEYVFNFNQKLKELSLEDNNVSLPCKALKLSEEVGEFSQAMLKYLNSPNVSKALPNKLGSFLDTSGKSAIDDSRSGVLEELVDCYIVVKDLLNAIGYTKEEFDVMMDKKLTKWENKINVLKSQKKTIKIVLNKSHTPFGLSEEAQQWYLEKVGYDGAFSDFWKENGISETDEVLVECVETLKEKSFIKYGRLEVVEIPSDVDYEIKNYDNVEWIAEKHRTWG